MCQDSNHPTILPALEQNQVAVKTSYITVDPVTVGVVKNYPVEVARRVVSGSSAST